MLTTRVTADPRCNTQAVQDGVAGALPTYFGTRDALVRIFQDEGWRALYAGIAPALLGAGVLHVHMPVMTSTYMHSLSFCGRTCVSSSGDKPLSWATGKRWSVLPSARGAL